MKNKIMLLALILLIILPITFSAKDNLGTFPTDENINLIQVCNLCTFNNITTVTAPNSDVVLSNVVMTKQGHYFNYTLDGQKQTGIYNVCGIGDLDGLNTIWCYDFKVTYTGKEYEINLIDIALIYFFLSGLYFILGIMNRKTKEKKDSTKVSTWLMLLSYTMIFIKAIALSYYILMRYIGADFEGMFYTTFYIDLFVLIGIATFTIIFAVIAYANPDEEKSKWEPEKWG